MGKNDTATTWSRKGTTDEELNSIYVAGGNKNRTSSRVTPRPAVGLRSV